MALHRALHERPHNKPHGSLHHTASDPNAMVTTLSQDFIADPTLNGLTLSRSAGSVYYFNGSGVLTATGNNVAAFTSNGLFIEGQATNLIAAANYRNFSTWSFETTDATVAVTQVGIDDAPNSACLLTDASGTGFSNKRLSFAVANDSASYIIFFFIKKDGDTSRFPAIRTSFTGGTTVVRQHSMINTSTGAITTYSTSSGSHIVDDVGGWWRVTQYLANNSTGNATLSINLYPAAGTAFGSASSAAQGSITVDWGVVCNNQIYQSPIQGAATRYSSFISRPWTGSVNDFWVYVDFNVMFSASALPSGGLYLFSIRYNATNFVSARLNTSSGLLRIESNNSGTAMTTDTTSTSCDRGDRYRVVVSYDSVNGLRCRLSNNGAAALTASIATSTAAFSLFTSSTTLHVGNWDNVGAVYVINETLREYKVGTGILTLAQQQELVGI